MRLYFFTTWCLVFLICGVSTYAQSTSDPSIEAQLEQEQRALRTQQLLLQRKKDSLYNVNAALQHKVKAEQKKTAEMTHRKYARAIAYDPVYSLFYYGVSFSYERALARSRSLYISLGLYDFIGLNEYRNTQEDRSYLKSTAGYRCLMEYRFYLLPAGSVFSGVYAGPSVYYKQRLEDVSENTKDSLGHYTYTFEDRARFGSAIGLGVVVGYQIRMSNRFVFDAYVRIGGNIGFGDHKESPLIGKAIIDPYNTSGFLGTGASIGYKF
ncbi:MAG: DUF3575 domain-containing protein [Cytophagaceae bacterium]|nr:DUF3575 domain-containing protein [Cytophagaceae bacterium]